MNTDARNLQQQFIEFALNEGVLKFGEFKTKSGRLSPYFFNAGLFNNGRSLGELADFYAETLMQSGVEFDMLFGPAYKGISLASATAVSIARKHDKNVPFAFNRKESKDHGEGGMIVGAPLQGRVIIIDDVITAGTSVNEAVGFIRGAGAEPAGILIALDRMERAGADDALTEHSAVQEVEKRYGVPVISIASLDGIMNVISQSAELEQYKTAVTAYRDKYAVK